MENALISVIMSTYNESEDELKSSIYSVLEQTYSNIEFIIVNDNPENGTLHKVLSSIEDTRVYIINNARNFGLVYSLNYAWSHANGEIIARMDADDICLETRLENQFNLMQKEKYDLLGCDIRTIDELGRSDIIHFPGTNKQINKKIAWFNCIAHPTWMVKKSLYKKLQGYRNIDYCEDYDFLLRALRLGYKVGNMQEVGLIYKTRDNSISNRNRIDQYLLSRYLAANRKKILEFSENDIRTYHASLKFEKERKKYISYCTNKQMIRNRRFNAKNILDMLINPYLYVNMLEKEMRKKLKHKEGNFE